MKKKSYTDEVLNTIVSQVVQIASPDKIILFGSRATGKAKKDSDYDICVLKRNIKKRRKLAQKIYMNLDVFASVDLIVNTPKRYQEIKNNPYYVYYDIEKFGQLIYEKPELN